MVSPNFQSMKSKNSWEIINYHAQWRTLHAIYAGENFTLLVKEWNAKSYSEQMCENWEIPHQLLSGYSLKWVFGFSKVNSRESLLSGDIPSCLQTEFCLQNSVTGFLRTYCLAVWVQCAETEALSGGLCYAVSLRSIARLCPLSLPLFSISRPALCLPTSDQFYGIFTLYMNQVQAWVCFFFV